MVKVNMPKQTIDSCSYQGTVVFGLVVGEGPGRRPDFDTAFRLNGFSRRLEATLRTLEEEEKNFTAEIQEEGGMKILSQEEARRMTRTKEKEAREALFRSEMMQWRQEETDVENKRKQCENRKGGGKTRRGIQCANSRGSELKDFRGSGSMGVNFHGN